MSTDRAWGRWVERKLSVAALICFPAFAFAGMWELILARFLMMKVVSAALWATAALLSPAAAWMSPAGISLSHHQAMRPGCCAPSARCFKGMRKRTSQSPCMAVGDVLTLDWAEVSEVQDGLRNAIADGKRVIELEVPTTDRFKDAPLNRINEANTLYARELVRMFTQPQELCVVFPDASECKYAIEDWGGPVPFALSSLVKPKRQPDSVDKYVVMNPTFDVREYSYMDQLYSDEVQPKDGTMIIFNAELFKLRQGGLMGYYPDIIFPKIAEVRRRLIPQVESAYYLRIFRGPPVGALYRKYPGPWMVLRALEGTTFDVLAEFTQQSPPSQDEVFTILQKAGPAPVRAEGASEQDKSLARMGLGEQAVEPSGDTVIPGWYSAVDPVSGLTYYYNDTGETRWDQPG